MYRLRTWLQDLLRREDGPTAVEYAIMLTLIIVVCITTIGTLGNNASNTYTRTGNSAKPGGS
jgi:pilus assembly protein Flp/PilA